MQFHLEVTDEMADEWARVPEYVVAAERALGAGGLERLLGEFRASADEMRADARTLFSRWVDLWAAIGDRRGQTPAQRDAAKSRGTGPSGCGQTLGEDDHLLDLLPGRGAVRDGRARGGSRTGSRMYSCASPPGSSAIA